MERADSTRDDVDFYRVRNPEQARLLSDPTWVHYLGPFLGRERSAAEAAGELGVRIDTLLYRVNKFLDAGLLEVVRERPRAGRPVRIYRTVADGFYVPFELTPFTDLEDRTREELRSGEEAIVRASSRARRMRHEEGHRIFRSAAGEIWNVSAGDEGKAVEWGEFQKLRDVPGPAYEAFASELYLGDAESKDLLIELYELFVRYNDVSSANLEADRGRRFLFRFQLAAIEDG